MLLQDVVPVSVWDSVINQGPTIAILGIGIYFLAKYTVSVSKKMESYMSEDRIKMIQALTTTNECVKNNTEALNKFRDTLEDAAEKIIDQSRH